jgi:hypothetical protein
MKAKNPKNKIKFPFYFVLKMRHRREKQNKSLVWFGCWSLQKRFQQASVSHKVIETLIFKVVLTTLKKEIFYACWEHDATR